MNDKHWVGKNIHWVDYQNIDRMNASTLVCGVKSMKSLLRALRGGFKEPTDAMRTGSGTHCILLEPEAFESRYCVVPDFHLDAENLRKAKNKSETDDDRRTDSKATDYYKDKVKQFAQANSGKEFVSRQQYDKMLHAIEAVRSHQEAGPLIESCGANLELSVIGEICGVPFKGRIDALAPTCIVDLKTTASVEPIQFGRMFANLYYGIKLAIYHDLIRQCIAERDVAVIAQEVDGDFDTVVYDVPRPVLENGMIRAQRILNDYKHAMKVNEWHGVDRGLNRIPLIVPQYAMDDSGDELVEWSDIPAFESVTEAPF